MEDVFKQNLLKLRVPAVPASFAAALFPGFPMKTSPKTLKTETSTEKDEVVKSFERFALDQLATTPKGFKVDGGEIVQKTLPSEYLKNNVESKTPGKVQVLFVTEIFRPLDEVRPEFTSGLINELLAGFVPKTATLFERMIRAMNLSQDQVCLYPVEFLDKDLSEEVFAVVTQLKPEIVVTLGAKATQKILKTNDRLSVIHGQFFPKDMDGNYTFQVVPLFHPTIIESNVNMKKTAWADMQKIMQHLKNLS